MSRLLRQAYKTNRTQPDLDAPSLLQQGRPHEAIEILTNQISTDPSGADRWTNLGTALAMIGDHEQAIEAFGHALRLSPSDPDIYFNLGNSLVALRQLSPAANAFSVGLELRPGWIEAMNNLGTTLVDCGQTSRGIDVLTEAQRLDPGHAQTLTNLGAALVAAGSFQQAQEILELSESIRPGNAKNLLALGQLFSKTGRTHEGISYAELVTRLQPDDSEAWFLLGNLELARGEANSAVQHLERAVKLDPTKPAVHSNLVMARNYVEGTSGEQARNEALRWAAVHTRPSPPPGWPSTEIDSIAFVSGDFCRHPVGFFLAPVLRELKQMGVSAHLFANAVREDAHTMELYATAVSTTDITALSDEEAAEAISRSGAKILIDLSGHTGGGRLGAIARRPCPLQFGWLGFSGTTGVAALDAVIADRHVAPIECDAYFSEAVIRLPHSFLCAADREPMPEPGPLPMLANRHLTLGSFNNASKLSGRCLAMWAEALVSIPHSRLLLKARLFDDLEAQAHFTRKLGLLGVEPERLTFAGTTDRATHFETIASCDIALDSSPYSGATTTLDCLSLGVPVLGVPGTLYSGRQTLSLLKTAGFEELVCLDRRQWLDKLSSLANCADELARLRADIPRRLGESPLYDHRGFTRGLVGALEGFAALTARRAS